MIRSYNVYSNVSAVDVVGIVVLLLLLLLVIMFRLGAAHYYNLRNVCWKVLTTSSGYIIKITSHFPLLLTSHLTLGERNSIFFQTSIFISRLKINFFAHFLYKCRFIQSFVNKDLPTRYGRCYRYLYITQLFVYLLA